MISKKGSEETASPEAVYEVAHRSNEMSIRVCKVKRGANAFVERSEIKILRLLAHGRLGIFGDDPSWQVIQKSSADKVAARGIDVVSSLQS